MNYGIARRCHSFHLNLKSIMNFINKGLWAGLIALRFIAMAQAQNTDTSATMMDPVVLSAWRSGEKQSRIAQQSFVMTQRDIRFVSQPTAAELLQNTGQVFIQKSQLGGGSPILRGFEANRVLLVVDGIRMNNAIYRAGHLQDVITLDQNMLSRMEVLFGPSSVMYGSDALGGVMHFFTVNPEFSEKAQSPKVKAGAMTRYSTAMQEQSVNAYLGIGGRKLAFRLSASYSDFGDLRAGSRRNFDDTSFGKRFWYQATVQGKDSFLRNDNPLLQRGSAYRQKDLFGKLSYRRGDRAEHTLNFQYSGSEDVPRYDRLSEWRNGMPRFAEWTYAPQNRMLLGYHLNLKGKEGGIYDEGRIVAAYQKQEQGRVSRRYQNPLQLSQQEVVDVFSVNADFSRLAGRQEWRYGAELTYNKVQSTAENLNINTGLRTLAGTRYPDGGSSMMQAAVYVHHLLKSGNQRWVFNSGIRASYIGLDASFTAASLIGAYEVQQRYPVLTFSEGVAFSASKRLQLKGLLSTGFRAPNVDDLGKVFESQTGLLIIPNPNVRAEQALNMELSAVWKPRDEVRMEFGAFQTWLSNALVLMDDRLNGKDSAIFQGSMSKVRSMQNAATARVSGAWASMYWNLGRGFETRHTWNYTYGRYQASEQAREVPMDHIAPAFGQSSVAWQKAKWRAEFYVRWSAAKRLEDYSPSGEDNLQYALPNGMPAWTTFNLRGSKRIGKFVMVQAALENIADLHYRQFASGISAPGRNISLTLRADLR
jgi:hemoglobin/transferrin/lactoferrin receptor protein